MSAIVPPLVRLQERFDALLKTSQAQATELARANQVLDAIAAAGAYEDPEAGAGGLVLLDGVQAPRVNPEIVVSITVNGKGVRTACVYTAESVKAAGWPTILAEACMSPLGLLARELAK